MQDRSSTYLRLLINRYHQGPLEALLAPLPTDQAKQVAEAPVSTGDCDAVLSAPVHNLAHVHYSWMIEPLKNMPKKSLPYLLGLLPQKQIEKIKHELAVNDEIPRLSPVMKRFIVGRLADSFPFKETPPLSHIPESELSSLANLQKVELVQLIDFLGLYDLAEEIHNIVDKRLLEKIYQVLTPKKKIFVKKCLSTKEKLVTNRLNLEFWDGSAAKLNKLIHHRGMVRLGYALCHQDHALVWHVTRKLDSGRGQKLLRYINDKEIPGVTKSLREQVLKVLVFFKKGSIN